MIVQYRHQLVRLQGLMHCKIRHVGDAQSFYRRANQRFDIVEHQSVRAFARRLVLCRGKRPLLELAVAREPLTQAHMLLQILRRRRQALTGKVAGRTHQHKTKRTQCFALEP